MNREDIIRMAREAGIDWSGKSAEHVLVRAMQVAYAAGATAEREACAKVCDDLSNWYTPKACAAHIRARGQA